MIGVEEVETMSTLTIEEPTWEDDVDVRYLGGHPKHHPLHAGLQHQELQQQSRALAIWNLAAAAAFVEKEEHLEGARAA